MQNLTKFFKKYQLIILLAVIAGFLLTFKTIISPSQKEPEQETPTIKPTVPQSISTIKPTTTKPTTTKSPTITPKEKTPTPILKGFTPTPEEFSEIGITEDNFMKNILEKFPLSPYLPYPDTKIKIWYTDPLALIITKDGAITAEKKDEILDWIKEQGVDPDTHQITWKEE